MKKSKFLMAGLAAALCSVGSSVNAEERPSRFYEDDAWYDITEWFDGNDYNPTDEALGRWDNETFEYADAVTSSDEDNDDINDRQRSDDRYASSTRQRHGDYGYNQNTRSDDRWFYDYYDDGNGSWGNENGLPTYTLYRDADDDGLYEGVTRFYDDDRNGRFDRFSYFSFDATAGDDQQAKNEARNQQKDLSSQQFNFAGQIQQTKTVDVRGRTHVVAHVRNNNGQTMAIDLGPEQNSWDLSDGDQLSAIGHRVQVGDTPLLIATKARSKSNDLTIDRMGHKFSGSVASTRQVKVRGQKHLLVKVKTDNGKSMLVDLGPQDKLENRPSEGDKIEVQGVPVKVNERVVLMARKASRGGDQIKISRKAKQQS